MTFYSAFFASSCITTFFAWLVWIHEDDKEVSSIFFAFLINIVMDFAILGIHSLL